MWQAQIGTVLVNGAVAFVVYVGVDINSKKKTTMVEGISRAGSGTVVVVLIGVSVFTRLCALWVNAARGCVLRPVGDPGLVVVLRVRGVAVVVVIAVFSTLVWNCIPL